MNHEFFKCEPRPCHPSQLPKFSFSCHERSAKLKKKQLHEQQQMQQGHFHKSHFSSSVNMHSNTNYRHTKPQQPSRQHQPPPPRGAPPPPQHPFIENRHEKRQQRHLNSNQPPHRNYQHRYSTNSMHPDEDGHRQKNKRFSFASNSNLSSDLANDYTPHKRPTCEDKGNFSSSSLNYGYEKNK